MDTEQKIAEQNLKLIGKQVRITKRSHPHFRDIGIITEIRKPVGLNKSGYIIKTDSGDSFFVFDRNQFKLI